MQNGVLLIVTQMAGILLLLSTVFLLFSRRIYLDSTTKQPIKFKLPVIGEISTQAPVIVLILIAAFMVVYPISRSGPARASLHGHIETAGKHVSAIVVAIPDYQFGQEAESDDFNLKIPLLSTEATYRVMFIVDKQVIDDPYALLKNGRIELKPVRWNPPPSSPEDAIAAKKEVSDEELKALSIPN
ncbi:MAG TPA: hypothetical protein VIX89_19570 [Bryobacteraceae bacterium]